MTRGQFNGLLLSSAVDDGDGDEGQFNRLHRRCHCGEGECIRLESTVLTKDRSSSRHAIFAVSVMRASSTDCVNTVTVCGKRNASDSNQHCL